MKAELFILPEKTHKDFREAFVLTREELAATRDGLVAFTEAHCGGFDLWYDEACLWEKMSSDLPRISFGDALERLRSRTGKVLFLSDSPDGEERGIFLFRGRPVTDFVAMADACELADCVEYEWRENHRLYGEGSYLKNAVLPDTLYVFDTTFEWVIVFTGEVDMHLIHTPEAAETRMCMAFGV